MEQLSPAEKHLKKEAKIWRYSQYLSSASHLWDFLPLINNEQQKLLKEGEGNSPLQSACACAQNLTRLIVLFI